MITPNRIVFVARALLALLLALTLAVYAAGPGAVSDGAIGVLVYATTLALLLGFPAVRNADCFALAAGLFTAAEFVSPAAGLVDGGRWLLAMAAIGAAVVPLRAQRIRQAACRNGYAPLVERRIRNRGPQARGVPDVIEGEVRRIAGRR